MQKNTKTVLKKNMLYVKFYVIRLPNIILYYLLAIFDHEINQNLTIGLSLYMFETVYRIINQLNKGINK